MAAYGEVEWFAAGIEAQLERDLGGIDGQEALPSFEDLVVGSSTRVQQDKPPVQVPSSQENADWELICEEDAAGVSSFSQGRSARQSPAGGAGNVVLSLFTGRPIRRFLGALFQVLNHRVFMGRSACTCEVEV